MEKSELLNAGIKIGENKTYLYTTFRGVKYGQSYPNYLYTLEEMQNKFAIFYYPFVEKNR